jgi:hypothetical protein
MDSKQPDLDFNHLLGELADLFPYESPLVSARDESSLIDLGFTYGTRMSIMHGIDNNHDHWSVNFSDDDIQTGAVFYRINRERGTSESHGTMTYDELIQRFGT